MPRNRITGKQYKQRMRELRSYVAFDYDLRKPLSNSAKAKINRYYAQLETLTIRPHQVYRARGKKNLRSVQRFAQHDPRFKEFTVAFVPTDGEQRQRIRINTKGSVVATTDAISRHEIPFDRLRLIAEGKPYIESVIARGPKVRTYIIQAGAFEVPSSSLPANIVNDVLKYMTRYNAKDYDADSSSSHYFGNWLTGVNGYNFRNQESLAQYRHKKQLATKAAARARVTRHRREQRQSKREPDYYANHDERTVKRDFAPQPAPWQKVSEKEYYRLQFVEAYAVVKA